MRILIHALAVRQHGGTARHLLNFLPALGAVTPEHHYTLYVDQEALLPAMPANITVHQLSVRTAWQRLWWDVQELPAAVKQTQSDAVWNLLGFGALNAGVPQIMFQRAPGYYCRHYLKAVPARVQGEATLRRWWQAVVMRRSSHIITPTAAMRDMIRRHHPDIPQQQFSVIPHAFRPEALAGELTPELQRHFADLPPAALTLLYIGHILPYKDLLFMLEVFATVRQQVQRPLYWFLTIDREDWPEGYTKFLERRQSLNLEREVILLGKLPGNVIGALYRACDVVLFTSLCESFGWPLLEATSLAKPLLAVDTPLNREMAGTGAAYYAPGDAEGATQGLVQLLSDEKLRQRLGAAGRRHFEETQIDWQRYVLQCHQVTQRAVNAHQHV